MFRIRGISLHLRVERLLSAAGVAILLGLVVFAGCTQPVIPSPAPVTQEQVPAPTTAATLAPQGTAPQVTQTTSGYLSYSSPRYGFSLTYPAGWSMVENSGAAAVVFTSPSGGMGEVPTTMTVTVDTANNLSLQQLVAAQLAKRQTLDNFNLIYYQAYKGSGFTGWKIAYTASQGTLMECVEVYIVRGTIAYTLTYSSREDKYAGYVVQMNTMFQSFQLTG